MRPHRLLIQLGVLVCGASHGVAQDAPTPPALVDQAKAAAARFHSISDAISAGYRAVGPEVPAMGQHWVNSRLLNGGFDPEHPAVLEYAAIEGRLALVGIAYAVLLGSGDSVPPSAVPDRFWHAHAGDLDEESLASSHAGSGAQDADRVAVLHVWVPHGNPAGIYAAENWTLPFLRAGFEPPPDAPEASGRALALGTGGLAYFVAHYRVHVGPDSAHAAAALLTAVADSVARWRANRAPASAIARTEVTWLADQWRALAARLPHGLTRR